MSSVKPAAAARTLQMEQRFLVHALAAAGLVIAGYQLVVRPEHARLSSAQASLAGQQHDIEQTRNLPRVVDDIPAAMAQMIERRDQLLARLTQSGDASTLYDTIGKLGQRCGVRTDRIDPVRADGRGVSGALDKAGRAAVTLESYGYQIEVIGAYENVARFIDAINTETGVSFISSLKIEPAEVASHVPPGSETPDPSVPQVRGSVSTLHFKLAPPKAKPPGDQPAGPGGVT